MSTTKYIFREIRKKYSPWWRKKALNTQNYILFLLVSSLNIDGKNIYGLRTELLIDDIYGSKWNESNLQV